MRIIDDCMTNMANTSELIGNSTLWNGTQDSAHLSTNDPSNSLRLFHQLADERSYNNVTSGLEEPHPEDALNVSSHRIVYYYMSPTHGSLGFGIPDSPLAIQIVNYCFGVTLIMIGLAGFFGNGLVLYVFTRYRRLRGGGGPLILSLAGGDFAVSLLHILPAYSSFNERWAFGSLGCRLYAASVGLCGLASLLTLSAIAADRFSVIFGRRLPWLARKKTCLVIWIVSLCLVLPPFLGWSQYCTEGMGTSCSWDYKSRDLSNRLYYIFLLTFGFGLPVSIITISYVGILRTVCKQQAGIVLVQAGLNPAQKPPTKSDMKTAQVIFIIIVCFLTAWTPYAIVSAVGQFGNRDLLTPLVQALPGIFAKTSIVFNPIVYGLSHPHFRSALRTLSSRSCWICRRRRHFSHNQQINYEHHHHHHHHHHDHRYHNNGKNGERKCGLMSKPWNCYDGGMPGGGGSPQVLLRDARNINRRRSTVWHFQQTGSSKTPSEPRTTTGQNLICTGVGNLSNQTMVHIFDAVTTSAMLGDVAPAPSISASSTAAASSYSPACALHPCPDVSIGTTAEMPPSRRDGKQMPRRASAITWADSRNLSEPDLSLLSFILKMKQGAGNNNKRGSGNMSEGTRVDLKTALARRKACPCSLEKRIVSRSENSLAPVNPFDHQQKSLSSASSWLQRRADSQSTVRSGDKARDGGQGRKCLPAPACPLCSQEWKTTKTGTGIVPILKHATPAISKQPRQTNQQPRRRRSSLRKNKRERTRRKLFGRLHLQVQSPLTPSLEERGGFQRNAMSVDDSMDDFHDDYLSSSATGQGGVTSVNSAGTVTGGGKGWRNNNPICRCSSRDGNQIDSGITNDLVVLPTRKPLWKRGENKQKEHVKLWIWNEKSCTSCSGKGPAINSHSLDDGFYSSFI